MCVFKLIFLYVLERDGGWLLMGLSSNMFGSLIFLSSIANSSVMLSLKEVILKNKLNTFLFVVGLSFYRQFHINLICLLMHFSEPHRPAGHRNMPE